MNINTLLLRIFLFVILPLSSVAETKQEWKDWAEHPPMGWNSYDAYHGAINEKQFKKSVDVLAEKLLPHGWEYAVIDFCWFNPGPEGYDPFAEPWNNFAVMQQLDESTGKYTPVLNMDEYGRLLPAINRFPSAKNGSGFKKLGEYVHSKGMKFGIHIMRGIPRQAVMDDTPIKGTEYTARDIAEPWDFCRWNNNMMGVDASKPGAQEYYNSLFDLYASWGVDYVKADDMTVPVYHRAEIEMMRKAIDQCGRPMILSLSCGETPVPEANHLQENANLWRVSIDFWDDWEDLKHMFDLLNSWAPFIGNGTWPDADMIPFGKLCLSNYPNHDDPNSSKREHESFFTWDEHQTLMTLWVMARSPMMWGGDPISSSEKTYSYLTNDTVLEVLKNSTNNRQLYHTFSGENENERIWVADQVEGSGKYLALFNISDEDREVIFDLELETMRGHFEVTDLWSGEFMGVHSGLFKQTLPPHGSGLYLFKPVETEFGIEAMNRLRTEFRIRDPYVLPDPRGNQKEFRYYMYSSITTHRDGKKRRGVGVYTSFDLQMWNGPRVVFEIPDGFWGEASVWAPEVHFYNGKYYLFTTLTSKEKLPAVEGRPEQVRRASQIFVSDSPYGPFLPFENQPHTPEEWMALDGTLWVEDGTPYMIFCREWVQITDGTMEIVELKPDLSAPVGEPKTLFKATDADWVIDFSSVGAKYRGESWEGYITDGCFLYRTKDDRLLMIWSSFGTQRYAIGMAYSESGSVHGPWVQIQEPLFKADGGHGMIFTRFDGQMVLALHQPNSGDVERAHFFKIEDAGDRLVLGEELAAGGEWPTEDE